MLATHVSRCTLFFAAIATLSIGCQSMKSSARKSDNALEGGGAIPAAAINRRPALHDLVGGDLGIGGGFLIAAAPDKFQQHQHQQALDAAQKAEESPVPIQLVHNSDSADLNGDGFVTLDEILAMSRSGLTDREIADRLQKTHYVFRLTGQQERYLTDRGVSQNVVGLLHGLSGQGTAEASL
jgi:hypothetical protein